MEPKELRDIDGIEFDCMVNALTGEERMNIVIEITQSASADVILVVDCMVWYDDNCFRMRCIKVSCDGLVAGRWEYLIFEYMLSKYQVKMIKFDQVKYYEKRNENAKMQSDIS